MTASVPQRLLALYGFLLARRLPSTRAQIRDGIEVYRTAPSETAFERMFERDKGALRALGAGVSMRQTDQGPAYVLDRAGTLLERPVLTGREKLLVSLASRSWSDPRFSREAQQTARRLGVDPSEIGAAPAPAGLEPSLGQVDDRLETALDALGLGQRMQFSYRRADEVSVPSPGADESAMDAGRRQVSPWGIGQRYGHWYLHGWDHDREAPRTFRLSRCARPALLAETSVAAPEGFSMDRVLDSLVQAPAQRGVLLAPHGLLSLVRDWTESGDGVREDPARTASSEDDGVQVPVLVHDVADLCACLAESRLKIRCLELSGLPAPEVEEAARSQVAAAEALQDRADRARVALAGTDLSLPRRSRVREDSGQRFLRLVDLLALVSERPGISVPELARHFGMTRRQIHQDLESVATAGDYLLGTADLRLDSSDGEVYVSLVEDLARPLALSPDQTLNLLLGLRFWAEIAPEHAQEAEDLAQKIVATASGGHWEDRVSVQVERDVADLLGTLQDAVAQQRPVEISYRSRNELEHRARRVLPLQLRTHGQQWLLEAQDLDVAAAPKKTYRMDAIAAVRPTERGLADGAPDAGQTSSPSSTAEHRLLWVDREAASLVTLLSGTVVAEAPLPEEGPEAQRPGLLVDVEVFDPERLDRFLLHHAGNVARWGAGD